MNIISRVAYKILINPLLSNSHKLAADKIQPGTKVLDIACGPGALTIGMAEKAEEVIGIDLSEELIMDARKTVEKSDLRNVKFILMDATDLSSFPDASFDVVSISMAIHQFSEKDATAVLKESMRVSKKLLIIDYFYPMNRRFYRSLVYLIESLAGKDHYRNFRSYNKNKGIDYYLDMLGIEIISKEVNLYDTLMVLECKKSAP